MKKKGGNSPTMAGTTVRGTAHEGQPQGQQHKLQRPVAIPQVHYKGGMPFTRAYSDALADCGITKEVLIQFIDQLNVQMLPHLVLALVLISRTNISGRPPRPVFSLYSI